MADIHDHAYRQIAEDGFAAVSMTGIAQNLGMSPAALYRYFPSRDELVRALIAESFEANAVLVEQSLTETAGLAPDQRLRHLLAVTREWAVAHPTQYGIIVGVLRDGQISEADAMVDPERRPFRAILSLVAELKPRDNAEVLLHTLTIWSRLSGVISLEINGVLDRMGVDATSFFDAEVDQLL